MRSESEIRADIAIARAAYQAIAQTAPAPEVLAASNRVKELHAELAAIFTAGANPCKTCGLMPHGMLRRPGYYEVGCAGPCQVELPHPFSGAVGPRAPYAHGATPADAVAAWNASEFSA